MKISAWIAKSETNGLIPFSTHLFCHWTIPLMEVEDLRGQRRGTHGTTPQPEAVVMKRVVFITGYYDRFVAVLPNLATLCCVIIELAFMIFHLSPA